MTALSWFVLVIGAALTVLLFAFGVRRLIGVRLPPLRTLAAEIIAVLVFSPIVTAMIGGPGFPRKGSALPALWFVILGAVIALLAGMVFLVIAEALVPSGSVPGPVYVLRAARGRMGRAGRYGQISRILARRGLLPYARGGRRSELATPEGRARLARSVRLAMEDGGVTFVKLGQVLSTRRDLLPVEFDRRYLTGLLHQVILVALAATSGVMAVLMLGLHGGPAITKTVTLYAFFGYCLLVIAAILALRVLVLVFRPDTR